MSPTVFEVLLIILAVVSCTHCHQNYAFVSFKAMQAAREQIKMALLR